MSSCRGGHLIQSGGEVHLDIKRSERENRFPAYLPSSAGDFLYSAVAAVGLLP